MKHTKALTVLAVLSICLTLLCGCIAEKQYSFCGDEYTITAPGSYKSFENSMSEDSVFELANKMSKRYIAVFCFPADIITATDAFAAYYTDNLSYTYTVSDVSAALTEPVSGFETCLVSLKLIDNEDTFDTRLYIINSGKEYVVFMCFTPNEINEKAENEFTAVVKSFAAKTQSGE